MKEKIYKVREPINELFLPKVSAKIPEGISKIFITISRMAYNKPISVNVSPFSTRNRIKKASKKRKFFKKP